MRVKAEDRETGENSPIKNKEIKTASFQKNNCVFTLVNTIELINNY